jgi:hypothetical protein
MVKALMPQEWDIVRHVRQAYFFDESGISAPYVQTCEDPKHTHVVLYQGSEIVVYTHIQPCSKNRAMIRMFVVHESCRNQGIDEEFFNLCERWLMQQLECKILHRESLSTYYFG